MSSAVDESAPRRSLWERLRSVAKPDSRFHYDFSHFIPDFEGASELTDGSGNAVVPAVYRGKSSPHVVLARRT